MSLIEEALRQVQEAVPPPPPAARPPASTTPRASSAVPTIRAEAHHTVNPVPTSWNGVKRRVPLGAPSQSDSNTPAAVIASLALVGLLSLAWAAGGWWARPGTSEPPAEPHGQSPWPDGGVAQMPQPFGFRRQPDMPAAAAPAFVLSGIMDQGGEKVAVVNNTIVQAGDVVDGARVLEVRSDSVWLRLKNQDVILKTTR